MAQINKPTDYFNTVTYTGAGTTTQSITGVGFQPDWIWIKNRSAAYSHAIQDVARGFGATYNLASNSTNAEGASGATGDNYGHVSTADSDGFTVTHTINGSNDGGTIRKGTHYLNDTYASWNWLAGGTASSNTDGSITSSVSANTTSGFSVVSYTGNGTAGATVGHGIDTPKMIIVKNRDDTDSWEIYHASLGETKYLQFTTSAAGTNTNRWNDTAPTSSVFSLGTEAGVNQSGEDFIAYCFAEKKGYSKIGKYRGNSNSDGVFVYLGFKPAFIMVKSDATEHWEILDNKRSAIFNPVDGVLFPNLTNAEETPNDICDFVSTGIKFRHSDGRHNSSSHDTYYMAFAENPLVGTNNIPATAR